MHGDLERLRLADRTEAILRSDRKAIRRTRCAVPRADILLTLVPGDDAGIDVMDAYLPDIADAAGLQYVRLVGPDIRSAPERFLQRAILVVADLTGRNEHVVTALYQALARRRNVLLTARDPGDFPRDLAMLPSVCYNLEDGACHAFALAVERHVARLTAGPAPLPR